MVYMEWLVGAPVIGIYLHDVRNNCILTARSLVITT